MGKVPSQNAQLGLPILPVEVRVVSVKYIVKV
jgi:hypothetical protein